MKLNDDLNSSKNEEIIRMTSKDLSDKLQNQKYTHENLDQFF